MIRSWVTNVHSLEKIHPKTTFVSFLLPQKKAQYPFSSPNTLSTKQLSQIANRNSHAMAIIDDLPGVIVEVVVDGEALKEYEDRDLGDDDDHAKTCYIEAKTGKHFQILIKVPKGFNFLGDCLRCDVEADGHRTSCPIVRQSGCRLRDHVREVQGMKGSNGNIREFMFTSLETGKWLPPQYVGQ